LVLRASQKINLSDQWINGVSSEGRWESCWWLAGAGGVSLSSWLLVVPPGALGGLGVWFPGPCFRRGLLAPFVDAVPGDSTFSPVRSAAVVCECGLVSSCPSGGLLLGGWGGALLACPAGLPCGVSWCLKEDLGWTAFGDHQGTVPHSLTVVFSFPGIVLGAYTPASSNGGILFLIVAFPRFVMEIEYPSGRLGCKTHYHTKPSLSTPRKVSARLVSRRPASVDAVKASKPIGRLLGKRRTTTSPEAPSTPKRPRTGLSARRALFTVKKAKP